MNKKNIYIYIYTNIHISIHMYDCTITYTCYYVIYNTYMYMDYVVEKRHSQIIVWDSCSLGKSWECGLLGDIIYNVHTNGLFAMVNQAERFWNSRICGPRIRSGPQVARLTVRVWGEDQRGENLSNPSLGSWDGDGFKNIASGNIAMQITFYR